MINHSNHTISLLLQAFENAITVVYALGGSTNGVLHLLALAQCIDTGEAGSAITGRLPSGYSSVLILGRQGLP